MASFASLSLDQLVQVLAHVDIRTRLSTCSLVSSTWRTAAASATTAVAVTKWSPSFVDWLQSHTAAVQVTSVSLDDKYSSSQVVLPLAQLRSLKSLVLDLGPKGWLPGPLAAATSVSSVTAAAGGSSASSSHPGGLEQLAALTQLKLTGCSIKLAGLSALTALLELACNGVDDLDTSRPRAGSRMPNRIADFKGAEEQLVAALPKLQQLTSLSLECDIGSAAVLAHLSALRALQQLEVAWTPADYPAAPLPQSLTRLRFAFSTSFITYPPHAITTPNAASLSRLTALQSLHLEGVRPLDTALLRSMTQLRELRLTGVEHVAGSQRLAVVSCFTALTALSIDGYNRSPYEPPTTIATAEAAALSASPHLVSLTLGSAQQLAPANWADLFPTGRRWHNLTQLTLPADFLGSPDTVRLVGRCAPNLQQAVFGETQHHQHPLLVTHEEQQSLAERVGEGVAALAGWPQLRQLSFRDPWLTVPGSVWESLGALSQVSSLSVQLKEKPCTDDLLALEGCTSLQSLDIDVSGDEVMCELKMQSTAPPGDPPNVSQRLAKEVWWPATLRFNLLKGRWQSSDEDDDDESDGAAFEEYGYADEYGNIFYH